MNVVSFVNVFINTTVETNYDSTSKNTKTIPNGILILSFQRRERIFLKEKNKYNEQKNETTEIENVLRWDRFH
jgi:hypothetical protein